MNAAEFNSFWEGRYAQTLPIAHGFKHTLQSRWFRIHSLPESKRYADTDEEWALLLERQNEILSDLLGEAAAILLVTGDFHYEGQEAIGLWPDVDSLKEFDFQPFGAHDMHAHNPDEYAPGWTYQAKFCQAVWNPGDFDALLRDIADDRSRAFFIALERDVMAAPYDGGIDFVLADGAVRDACKLKYKAWLSARKDGL